MYLIAAFSRYPTAEENTSFVIFGFAFVVFVLLALAIMTAAIGILFKRTEANAKQAEARQAPATSAPLPQKAASATENEHIPYLIAAAVATIMDGQSHRIVSINPRSEGWAQEGRRQIFSSHKVR